MLTKLRDASFSNANWRELGLKLGLRPGTLAVIDQQNQKDPNRCHTECLTKWLQRADDVDDYGKPTYNVLADALDKVDDQKDQADYIRKYIIHI